MVGRTQVEALSCRAVSSERQMLMVTLLSWPSLSPARSEGHAGEQGLSSCTEFCSVHTHIPGSCKPRCGGQSKGPRLLSKPTCPIWPRRWPPGAATSPGRWDGSVGSTEVPIGAGAELELGFGSSRLNVSPWSPPLSLDRTRPGQDCPVLSPFPGTICPMTQGAPISQGLPGPPSPVGSI